MNAGGVDEEQAGDQRQLAHRERVRAPADVEVDDLGLGQVEAAARSHGGIVDRTAIGGSAGTRIIASSDGQRTSGRA